MIVASAKKLASVPGECGAIKRHEHEAGFGTREQQGRIIQTEPNSILPVDNVDYREFRNEAPASGYQPMRSVFVSQKPQRHVSLPPVTCRSLREKLWRKPARASPARKAS